MEDSAAALANETAEDLDCPDYSDESERAVAVFSFWCEGVALCVFAVLGLIGNTVSGLILSGKSMRNSFNLLLIALAVYDNTYLFCSVLESFRKRFGLDTDAHIILFPYFLYPLHMIAMTGSILMTVAIALERYVAVHYPINYSQAMNDVGALRGRMMKYLVPVVTLSILMNVTKFFEIELTFAEIGDGGGGNDTFSVSADNDSSLSGDGGENDTYSGEYEPRLKITDFRMDPIYSIYFNWFRFISIGVIPFALLVYFNLTIYTDIRQRRLRKLATVRQQQPQPSVANPNTVVGIQVEMTPMLAAAADQQNGAAKANDAEAVDDEEEEEEEEGEQNKAAAENKPIKVKVTKASAAAEVKPPPPPPIQKVQVTANDARRRIESNLAAIMMGYVLVFLVCHSPRLLLNIHELAIIREGVVQSWEGNNSPFSPLFNYEYLLNRLWQVFSLAQHSAFPCHLSRIDSSSTSVRLQLDSTVLPAGGTKNLMPALQLAICDCFLSWACLVPFYLPYFH